MKQTFFLMSVLISVYEMKQNVKLSRHLSLLGIKKYNSQIFYYEMELQYSTDRESALMKAYQRA